jgi:hypothetical protein
MGHQKNKESTWGDRIYRETVSEIFFHFMPLLHQFFEQNSSLGGPAGI